MTQPLKLIGLAGPAGCGKDPVAQILCDTQEFRRISLVDPIRQGISTMLEIPWDHMIDHELKELPMAELCGKSPRQAMQTLGTEWGRNCIDPHIWLKVAERKMEYIRRLAETGNAYISGIVISDIRFPGEAKWLREQGGSIWHIRRPNNPNATKAGHESEIPLIPEEGDSFIINDGDIDKLFDDVLMLMQPSKEAA
ncbi:hypothetical protein Nit79A3_2432 [Nitrosomonas sp. Is79A3]|uniref:deoxynucleotide monophosphate kinase family protein n=1 Tax=Nitrosomonas sp. (strain Is79A3) TaxID=261292 RepID=UPI000215CADF